MKQYTDNIMSFWILSNFRIVLKYLKADIIGLIIIFGFTYFII